MSDLERLEARAIAEAIPTTPVDWDLYRVLADAAEEAGDDVLARGYRACHERRWRPVRYGYKRPGLHTWSRGEGGGPSYLAADVFDRMGLPAARHGDRDLPWREAVRALGRAVTPEAGEEVAS